MRQIIAKYGVYIISGALVLALVIYFFSSRSSGPAGIRSEFYVDEETGATSVQPLGQIPPLEGKSGRLTLVKAFKISCDGGRSEKIAYLQKYTPEAQSQMKNLAVDSPLRAELMRTGLLIRRPEAGSPWVKDDSEEGRKIHDSPPCAAGQTVTQVFP